MAFGLAAGQRTGRKPRQPFRANPVFGITLKGWCRQPLRRRRFGRRDNAAAAGKPSARMRVDDLPGMSTKAELPARALAERCHAAAARRELP